MKISAAAVGLTAVMCASACSSSSSSHSSSSSTSSTSTASASSSSSTSASGDAALVAQIKPLPGAGHGWVLRQKVVGYGTDIIAVQDADQPTKILGLSDRDGSTVWTIDLKNPPKALADVQDAPSIHQIGSSLAIAWPGNQSAGALNTPTPMRETVVFDLTTGKERGTPWMETNPGDGSEVATSLAYAAGTTPASMGRPDSGKYVLQDGTVDTNYQGLSQAEDPSTYPLAQAPAGIAPFQGSLMAHDIDATTSLLTWTDNSTHQPAAAVYDRKAKKLAGKPLTCDSSLNPTNGTSFGSADNRYVGSGALLADLTTHAVTCLKIPSNSVSAYALSSNGTVYATANGHFITMPLGKTSTTMLPAGTTMPGAVLTHAAIYDGVQGGEGTATVVIPSTRAL